MRVLILYPHLGPGVANFLIDFARCLARRGHEPILGTRGGPGLARLEEYGIEHYPIETKFPGFLTQLRPAAEFVRHRGIDLIDSRDHKAGSVGYLLARMTGRPYLLGIHAPKRWYNRFHVYWWSDPIMVVNRADLENLVNEFKVSESRIVITSVGIDTRRFAPAPPNRQVLEELGLVEGAPVVMLVSRFDNRKTRPAQVLIESIPAVAGKVPQVTAVLVGRGKDLDALRAQGEATNASLGREAVRVLGYRSDVAELLTIARVVVGTGKAGLEAMASGKPLIGAGRFGTTGLVGPENAQLAEDTLFADHGPARPYDAGAMAAELERVFTDGALEERLRRFGPEFAARFDIEKITDGVLKLYQQKLDEARR